MKFSEVVDHASALLQRKERITYRALRREFALDEEALEDLKAELIDAQRVATDEEEKVLVWTGGEGNGESAKRKLSVLSSQLLVPSPQPLTPSPQRSVANSR